MTSHDFTDSSRMNAAVDRICFETFPLADNPDFPIGPLPLFKVRDLLAEAYRAACDHQARAVDRCDTFEECLHATRALVAGASFLHAEGDGNGTSHLLAIALAEIDRATECRHE